MLQKDIGKSQISEKPEPKAPTTAPLRVAERSVRLPEPAATSPSGSVARAAPQPREPERPRADASPASAVEIKADELSARISGCNLAFRALEAELDEKGVWTSARLEPLADRLKILVLRRHDLHLFREAVPEDKRASIERLASAKRRFRSLRPASWRPRARAKGADFKGTDAERQAELKRLDELSRRLAEMDGEIAGGAVLNWSAIPLRPAGMVKLTTTIGSIISPFPCKSSTWANRPL